MKKTQRIESKRINYIKRLDGIDSIENLNSIKEFDEDGNLLLDIQYDSHGNISEKFAFEYKNGKLNKKTSYLDEEEVADSTEFFYNSDGKLTHTLVHYIDGSTDKIVFEYDAYDNLISKKSEDGEGAKEILNYENNRMIYHKVLDDFDEVEKEEQRSYSKDGVLMEVRLSSFDEGELRHLIGVCDEKGQIVQELVFNDKSQKISEKNLTYNDAGLLLKVESSDDYGHVILDIKYDEKGNEILQSETKDGELLLHKVQRKYNDDNQIILSEIEIFNHGKALDLHYSIETTYTYF